MEKPLELVLSRLQKVKKHENDNGNWYEARCPAHDDHKPSLSVRMGDERVLLYCHAGCKYHQIVAALGLTPGDLFYPNGDGDKGSSRIVATYDYTDATGELLFQTVRKEPKGFFQRHPDGNGDWINNIKGVDRVLYQLPLLLAADPSEPIFVCEGEKNADAVADLGLVATTNPMGAGKWQPSFSEALRGHRVCILPDNDAEGEKHAATVAKSLAGVASEVRIVRLPDVVAEKSDPADWVAAGGTKAELLAMLEKAGPVREAPEEQTGWHWRTLKDAYQDKAPRKWIVVGLVAVPSVVVFFGQPGGLKTLLVQSLAVCVAAGLLWLASLPEDDGAIPFRTQRSSVLWLDFDCGLDRIERRFAAVGRAHGLPEDAPLAYVSFPWPSFIAQQQESVDLILDAIRRTGAQLVVFDNLAAISGGADENSSQMVAVMAGLRQIAELGQCAVIVIHHKSKGSRDRAGDSLRGHSSIEAAVDLALLVERDGDSDNVMIRSTKTRDVPVPPFVALWAYEQDQDGELVRGRFFGLGQPESDGFSKQEQAIYCQVFFSLLPRRLTLAAAVALAHALCRKVCFAGALAGVGQ